MKYLLAISLIASSIRIYAQTGTADLHIIKTPEELQRSYANDSMGQFVALTNYIPGVIPDIRYATTNNFTGRKLYAHHKLLLRRAPATALRQIQAELKKQGLGIKVYDAYRPYAVTCAMWKYTPDRRYTANPKRGSHHNRGTAVDVTLVNLRTGKELDMGTGYDCFNDSAHHAFTQLPAEVHANRKLLKNTMCKYGYNYVPTEWWHYHWRDKHYDLVDLDFSQIH